MEKDFIKWRHLKEKLQKRANNQFVFNEGDVWICSLGLNLGHEEDGKGDIFLALPITSKEKTGNHYYSFDFGGKQMTAILYNNRPVQVIAFIITKPLCMEGFLESQGAKVIRNPKSRFLEGQGAIVDLAILLSS